MANIIDKANDFKMWHDRLREAVVRRAVNDYRILLCSKSEIFERERKIKDLEDFFLDDIKIWTNIDGKKLMERIKQECADNGYDLERLRQSLHEKRTKNKLDKDGYDTEVIEEEEDGSE